ncbi:MAG: beta-ketoacyl-[acyl-carrier-protein] synthase family protein [Phycisphaeraceae bacterium]
MTFRRVAISGLGPVSGLGLDIEDNWRKLAAGESSIGPIAAFDPAGFSCRLASEVGEFKIRDFVPKSYRKATKVMARDIELAVIAADGAARDAGLVTKGTDPEGEPTHPAARVGAHIGAGLIACDLDELTGALVTSRDERGGFDIHRWGESGMEHLTPLWLLKYLPNMLACHVTIIHDAQGPSNTITCAEASGALSLGESLRVIQRGAAEACFCGGAETKLNPMAYIRQEFTGRLLDSSAMDDAADGGAIKPFDRRAAGGVLGEGGGIVVVEAIDALEARGGKAYAEVVGFGATQSVDRASLGTRPDAEGRATANAIRAALRWAELEADAIDAVFPFGSGVPEEDAAEIAGLRSVFDDRLARIPAVLTRPLVGNLGAGAGGFDLAIAAKALAEQQLPKCAAIEQPIEGATFTDVSPDRLDHLLVLSAGYGGQHTAVILKRV